MMLVAMGEVLVLALIRPIRFICGGKRTSIGRLVLRFENWILHHLHVINVESQMRQEIDRRGTVSSFLADGLSDQSDVMPSTSDTVERVRRDSGAVHSDALAQSEHPESKELRRGQRQVDATGGGRSDDIKEAMLRSQREQDRREAHARRRR